MKKTSGESALAWLESQNFTPAKAQVEKIIAQLKQRITQPMDPQSLQDNKDALQVMEDILPQLEVQAQIEPKTTAPQAIAAQPTTAQAHPMHTAHAQDYALASGSLPTDTAFDSRPLGDAQADNQRLTGQEKQTAFSNLRNNINNLL